VKLTSFLVASALAGPAAAQDSLEEAGRRLGAHYYKGSELERRINWIIGTLPVKIQLTASYLATVNQVYSSGMVTWTTSFP
jgi:hypothetical protein